MAKQGSYRERQIFAAVDRLTEMHNQWVDDANRPAPDGLYWDVLETTLETIAAGDIPESCRPIEQAAQRMVAAIAVFDDREDQRQQYPHDGFWEARQALEDCRKTAKPVYRPKMESIKELAALPGMTHAQIAKMWGFADEQGNPMPWLVQRELDTPGIVIDKAKDVIGPHWRHPDAEDEGEAVEEPQDDPRSRRLERKRKQAEQDGKPCPETTEQLYEQGVPVEQAAKMLRKSPEDVQKLFDEIEQAKPTTEAKVINYVAEGRSVAEISKLLDIPSQKVKEIIDGNKATK